MPRKTLLRSITLACACLVGGRAIGAQTTATDTTTPAVVMDSSRQVRALPAMRVTAEKPKASREPPCKETNRLNNPVTTAH